MGVRGEAPPGNCLDSNSFKSPFLTNFRKTVETGVDPRLFRIAGLEERTSRWVVMEQLTFMRIFGSTLHFAAFILWIMLILVNFERSLLPPQVNVSPSVTFQSEDNQSTLCKGIPPLWMPLTTRVVKDLSKHTTQWYESQLITTESLFEARKLKKWILWILSEQFVV